MLVAALIQHEGLEARAGWDRGVFAVNGAFRPASYHAPREVDTVVNHRVYNGRDVVVQVAGGVRSAEKAEEMPAKASRVVIGTMAYSEPETVRKLAKKNSGKIVISIDQVGGNVMVKGWKESTGTKVADAISQFSAMGVDEFLLTSVERDGTLQGPDVRTLAEAARSARIIASGGIARLEDIVKIRSAGCSSVILGKAMYDGRVSIEKVKALA